MAGSNSWGRTECQGEWDRMSVTCPSKEQDLVLSVMGNLRNLWKESGVSELVVRKTTWVYIPDEMCYVNKNISIL